MANDRDSYRLLVNDTLASAVDTSTWTNSLMDDSLRQALAEYDNLSIYEADFTVTATAEEQDLSSVSDLNNVLAVAYPWTDGANFASRQQHFRHTNDQTIYFETLEPIVDQVIRIRYTKLHAIKDLPFTLSESGAAATTVPIRHTRMIGLLAACHACNLRIRQVSENPAIPTAAATVLKSAADQFCAQAARLMSTHRANSTPHWDNVGL